MDEKKTTPRPRRRRGLKIFGIILLILILLLVAAFFIGTSEGFVKSVVLPRVSKSMNADVTVESATIKPFSEVRFRNLKVVPKGREPLLNAEEVHARYDLMKIIGGNVVVSEVTIASPTIQIVENADGSTNLDPLTKGKKDDEEKPPSKPSKPPQIDLKKFVLSNATLRRTKNYEGGKRDFAEISKLNITLENLKNGESGKLTIDANLAANNNPPAPGTNGVLDATLNGTFDFALKSDLMPASVKGATDLAVKNAAGAFTDFAGTAVNLAAELTPTDLKQVALRLQRSGATLAEIRAAGPFDTSKLEGRVGVQIISIDRNALNLVGAASGLDFGSTTINSTNQIEFAQSGSLITTIGAVNVGKFAVTRAGQTTPTLDLQTAYHISVDRADQSANIQVLTLTGTQNQKQLLRGGLDRSMKIAWGDTANPAGDSSFNLTITGLNLADWKPFVGDVAPTGVVGLNLQLMSQQSGKMLTFDAGSDVQGLTVNAGANSLVNLGVKFNAQGSARELKQFDLKGYRVTLAQGNQPMLSLAGAGKYDKAADSADMQLQIDGNLPTALKALAQTNATASAGTLALKARVVKNKASETVTGNLTVADFTGQFGNSRFDRFGTAMDLDIAKNNSRVAIRKAAGKLSSAGNQGGAFDLSGDYDLDKKSGQIDMKLADFNQNGLRPFLESALADKKLVSININATTSARLDGDDAAIKTTLQVTNLVVADPKKQIPETPLEAKLQLDVARVKNVVDLRQMQATLTPTERAKNELQLTGKIDMSNPNAKSGNLKLASDSLDVTRYYDLFAKKSETAEQKPTAGGTSPSPRGEGTQSPGATKPQKEPDAIKLPVKNFSVDANIGRFYLREIEITNLQTGVKLDQSTASIDPLQLAINGSPVRGKVLADLSVPGYKYDIAFNGGNIPLEPLANSFIPDKKGMYKGILISDLQVKGAGVTGTSMQKNLSGQFNFNFTNANIQIVGDKLKGFLMPIAIFLGAPDLLESPLNQMAMRGNIGGGKINVDQLSLVSEAFVAQSAGPITITDELMKSTFDQWPMNFYIRRSLAQKVRIAPKNAPADQKYVALPQFIQVTGTLEAPKPKLDLNVRAIAGTVLQNIDRIPGVDPKAGGVIQGLGNILSGRTNRAPTTNAPAGTPPEQPTQPATNAPARPGTSDLLDRFFKKK
jgi:uncharacterized protein involved in outer membrane biogenesis